MSVIHAEAESRVDREVVAIPALIPVKLGLVGLNFGEGIARHVIRSIPHVEVAGLCDQNLPKLQTLSEQMSVPAFGTLEEMLEDPSIEAIGLFTGPLGRASLISKILQKGRHIMTTKPFELDVRAAARVLEDARQRDLVLHLNSPAPRLSEDLQQIQNWISTHGLGRPISLQAKTWARYREKANGTWYDDAKLCPAAPILRLGIYFLNDFSPLMGTPRKVYVAQSRIFTGRPTVDHAQASIEYENGATASVMASFCVEDGRPYQDEVTLNYERGTIRRCMVREVGPDMSRDHAVLELRTPDTFLRHEATAGDYAGWYQWMEFARAVRGDTTVTRQYPAKILGGLRLLNAISRSATSGQPEPVD